ncbi:MAG: FAD-dependent thymidylate synthase [Firmicutes bacterium]|nr:FAD-dependent thymidylate synthase [Bacillota bacterium]
MLQVTLINYTPEPEKTVAAAARLCYSPRGAVEIMDDFTPEKVDQFLGRLTQMGHFSPTEHVTFTFAIEGISRALSHQLVRHRIASYSQKSQRYVKEDNFTYIVPPSIKDKPQALEAYNRAMEEIRAAYQVLIEVAPKEDARYVLPNACETKLVATFNCRSLHNFFALRCCERAQWEIRELAEKMLAEVRKVAPRLFATAGPSCKVEGVCYEGDMSCGRAPLIQDLVKANKKETGE